jgi:hypothetical protein
MERKRFEPIRTCGMQVHLLTEAVGMQKKRPLPAGGQRRKRRGVERQRNLVTRRGYHELVVGRFEQNANVSKPGVATGQRLPRIELGHSSVVIAGGLKIFGHHFRREPTPS